MARRLPPKHLLDEDEQSFGLGSKVMGGVELEAELFQRLSFYNGRVYDFCLRLVVSSDDEVHEVERVDCCHDEVHRHRFHRSGGEDRVVLAPLGEGWYKALTIELDRAYDHLVDNWEQVTERWWSR